MSKKPIIILDPGHDTQWDNRSPVVPNYTEGLRMWDYAHILRQALAQRGFVVKVTKSQVNQTITVTERGRMARGCDLLISLHSNCCDTESVDRPCGIYLVDDNCGDIDHISQELATKLSQAVREVMDTNDPAKQYSKLSGGDRDGDGKVNDDYYGVLYGAHQVGVAAIILEHSFHSNRRAATWLMSDDNLARLASATADSLAGYYGLSATNLEPPETPDTEETLYCVQLGAYRVRSYAEDLLGKVQAAGFSDAYITIKSRPVPATPGPDSEPELKKGDTVRVKPGAPNYSGQSLASFVYERNHQVSQINGDRVVITYRGEVTAAMHRNNLIRVR